MARMFRIIQRCAPECHDAIADELIQRATVTEYNFDLQSKISVQQFHYLLRGAFFRQGGETADIGEQYGDLAAFARAAQASVCYQFLHHMRIDEAAEHLYRLLARFAFAQVFAQGEGEICCPCQQDGRQYWQQEQLRYSKVGAAKCHQGNHGQPQTDLERMRATQKSEAQERQQQQGNAGSKTFFRFAHRAAIFQIVYRSRHDLHGRIQAIHRRCARIVQTRGLGTDNDDLALQLILGAQRVRAVEILIQIGIGNMLE